MATREDRTLALLEELRNSAATGQRLARENAKPGDESLSPEFQARTDRALATADSILAARREPAPAPEEDVAPDELAADAGQPSPGGVYPAQARFLKKLREQGRLERSSGQEFGFLERAGQRFSAGVADELTLGRGELLGEDVSRETGEAYNVRGFDVGDVAELAGRFVGAAPLALTSGGVARVGARTIAKRVAARNPGTARALLALSDGVTRADAPRLMRMLASNPSRNLFEGAAYSAVAGPLRKLEDGQSRARAIAGEVGIGAGADFLLGFVMGAPGAALDNSLRHLFESDNLLDRELAQAVVDRIPAPESVAQSVAARLSALEGPGGAALEPPVRANRGPEADMLRQGVSEGLDARVPDVVANEGPEASGLRAAVAQGLSESDVAAGRMEDAGALLRRELTQEDELRSGVETSMRDPTVDRQLPPGPPEYESARFRSAENQEPGLAAPTAEGTIEEVFPGARRPSVGDTRAEVAGLLPPEAGGPRLAGGATDPELAALREDVSIERNRPFNSRLGGAEIAPDESVARLTARAERARAEGRTDVAEALEAEIRARGGEPTPVTRPEAAPVEEPGAPEATRGEPQPGEIEAAPAASEEVAADELTAVDEALGAGAEEIPPPKVRSRNAQAVVDAIANAGTAREAFAAASDLAAMRGKLAPDEADAIADFLQRKMDSLGGPGAGAGRSPRPEGPSVAPEGARARPATEPPAAELQAPEPEAPAPRQAPEPDPFFSPDEAYPAAREEPAPAAPREAPEAEAPAPDPEVAAAARQDIERIIEDADIPDEAKADLRMAAEIEDGQTRLEALNTLRNEYGGDDAVHNAAMSVRGYADRMHTSRTPGAPGPQDLPGGIIRNRDAIREAVGDVSPRELAAEEIPTAVKRQMREATEGQLQRVLESERRYAEGGEWPGRNAPYSREQARARVQAYEAELARRREFAAREEPPPPSYPKQATLVETPEGRPGVRKGSNTMYLERELVDRIRALPENARQQVLEELHASVGGPARRAEIVTAAEQAAPRRAKGPMGTEFDVPPEVQRQLEEGRGAEEALEVERRAFDEERRALTTDPVAGVANQQAFRAAQPRIDADPEQFVTSFDMTNFKAINDFISRQAGDARLAEAGRVMREVAEEMGIPQRNVFRDLGDEFYVATGSREQAEEFGRRVTEKLEPMMIPDPKNDRVLESAIRYGVGDTVAKADAAVNAAKLSETGAKYRDLSAPEKADLRPRTASKDATPAAEQASVADIPEGARAPEVENGVTEIEAREWEAKANQERELIRERIQGNQGKKVKIVAADGTEVQATYEVVELDEVVPSHDPESGFRSNEENGFPEEAQNRDYENDSNAQASVVNIGRRPDFRVYLDTTIRPTEGPPMIFVDGVAANGNSRIMGAKLWDAARQEDYRAALTEAAEQFGLDPEAVRGMKRPLLVRVVDDPAINPRNVGDMAGLNRAFDKQSGKVRSPEREAAFKVEEMLRARNSLEFLQGSIEADETVRAYLDTTRGREFLDNLVADGVIAREELSQFQDELGRMTDYGKTMIEKMMENAALRDPDVVRQAPRSWLRKIQTATPAIVKASQIDGWDLTGVLQDAFRLGIRIDQNPNITGADRVGQLMRQLDLFGAQELNPQVVALARAIDDGNPNAVKKALRGFAADAQRAEAGRAGGSLFGEEVTFADSFRKWFGEAKVQADGTIQGGRGEAVEMEQLMGDLRGRILSEGDREGRLPEHIEDRIVESFPDDMQPMARGAASSGQRLIDFAEERGILGERMLRAALNQDPPPGASLPEPPLIDGDRGGYFDAGGLFGAVRKLGKRWFTGPGDLREDVWRMSLRQSRWATSETKRAAFRLNELRAALKQVYGSANLTEKQLQPLREYLTGGRPLSTLPEPLREPAGAMRLHVDGLSQKFIDLGLVQGDLEATFAQNMGAYLTRTYRIFSDPEWASKVPKDVKNRAIALFKGGGRTEEEARLLVEELLLRADDEALTPLQFLAGKSVAPKDLSILTRRKDIAPEIRELWGEETHPLVNYVRSVDRMASTLSQHKFLSELAEMGEGNFLFRKNTAKGGEDFIAKIAPEQGGARWSPVQGLKGTKEFRDALHRHLRPDRARSIGAFRFYMKLNGAVKFSKIIPSLATQVRNVQSMLYFSTRNGNFPLSNPSKALKTALLPFSSVQSGVKGQTIEVLGEKMSFEEFFLDGVERGVIAESARANELLDVIQDAQRTGLSGDADWILGGAVGKAAKGALRVGTELYRAGDDVVKVANYLAELQKFRKAIPESEMNNAEIKDFVSQMMREEFPTYSEVPEIVKELRRIPLVGTFVSWPWEVYRTNFNFLNRTREFIRSDNPALRKIGWTRAVGMGVAGMGISASVAATSRFISGIDDQNEEAMRRFLPSWSENNPLVWAGRDENGHPRYIDQGYTDPFTPGKAAWKAFMRGEDFGDSLARSSWTLLEPFLGEEILAGKLIDLARNQTKDGRRIWNPELPEMERRAEQFKYLVEAITPGTLERMENAIRRGDVKETAIGEVSGMRIRTLNVPESLGFNARDQVERRTDATRILSRAIFDRRATVEDVQQAYRSMESARRSLWEDAHKDAVAAYQLGMDERSILTSLNEAGWSRQDAVDILIGRYRPWTPGPRSMEISPTTSPEDAQRIIRNKGIVGEMIRQSYQQLNETPQEGRRAP